MKRFPHNCTQQEQALERLRTSRQSHLDNEEQRLQTIQARAEEEMAYVREQTKQLLSLIHI